ncbi:MAG: hypothetical protein CMH32_06685 [Micavibrio sp.]|nr:hypothetical protein [Micavibrio sp.]HCK33313.1 hypothetical protein [Rhodospirillaceae bacterium]
MNEFQFYILVFFLVIVFFATVTLWFFKKDSRKRYFLKNILKVWFIANTLLVVIIIITSLLGKSYCTAAIKGGVSCGDPFGEIFMLYIFGSAILISVAGIGVVLFVPYILGGIFTVRDIILKLVKLFKSKK